MATCSSSTLEKWVIGADKKPKFVIKNKTLTANIALSVFSGYGVIIYYPEGSEMGRFGINLAGFSNTEVHLVDAYTFEIALDKSLNTQTGTYKYRIYTVWADSAFADSGYDAFNDDREELYDSVEQ